MKKFAPILIVLAGCFWGTLGLFVRKLTDMGLDSLDIGAIRNTFTAVILFLIVGLRDRKSMKIKLKSIPWLAAAGIFSVVLIGGVCRLYGYATPCTLCPCFRVLGVFLRFCYGFLSPFYGFLRRLYGFLCLSYGFLYQRIVAL